MSDRVYEAALKVLSAVPEDGFIYTHDQARLVVRLAQEELRPAVLAAGDAAMQYMEDEHA